MDKLQEIKTRLESATQGPWKWDVKCPGKSTDGYYDIGDLTHWEDSKYGLSILEINKNKYNQAVITCWNTADSELISNAPSDIAYLLGQNERMQNFIAWAIDISLDKRIKEQGAREFGEIVKEASTND